MRGRRASEPKVGRLRGPLLLQASLPRASAMTASSSRQPPSCARDLIPTKSRPPPSCARALIPTESRPGARSRRPAHRRNAGRACTQSVPPELRRRVPCRGLAELLAGPLEVRAPLVARRRGCRGRCMGGKESSQAQSARVSPDKVPCPPRSAVTPLCRRPSPGRRWGSRAWVCCGLPSSSTRLAESCCESTSREKRRSKIAPKRAEPWREGGSPLTQTTGPDPSSH